MKVSRRNFLATAGAAGVAPLILGATNKSGSQAPILGEGDYQYEDRVGRSNCDVAKGGAHRR